MKKNACKKILPVLAFALVLAGCGQTGNKAGENNSSQNGNQNQEAEDESQNSEAEIGNEDDTASSEESSADENVDSAVSPSELEVCFGDDGEPFTLHLYNNDTAAAIAKHVGTASWRLPIYHYDDYENWEVMQYYDIPSRYEIPSNDEAVVSEKAGDVYYSEPNRIILFYGDANVTGEYTKVGYFDDSEEFRKAVEDNPALEGWGTKMVLIQSAD